MAIPPHLMLVTVIQQLGEDDCNGLASVPHLPLNVDLYLRLMCLRSSMLMMPPRIVNHFMDDHFITTRHLIKKSQETFLKIVYLFNKKCLMDLIFIWIEDSIL